MIRFQISNGNALTITEWENEPVTYGVGQTHTAVSRINELRQTHGNDAEISIERTTVIPEGDRRLVRFKIVKGKETRYSKAFPISEKEERLTEIKEKFPKARVTTEIING